MQQLTQIVWTRSGLTRDPARQRNRTHAYLVSDALPAERERIANEIGVRSITLTRWITGESTPRPHNLRQLLHALPKQHRDLLSSLLGEEHIDLTDTVASEPLDEIDYQFIRQVFETRATTSSNLLFW